MNRQNKKNREQRKLGMERIESLFELAEKGFGSHPERAHRNVLLARKIAMRYNIRIPLRLRRKFCSKCYKYLKPNVNCSTKLVREYIAVKCLECGNMSRHPSGKKRMKR